jgi:ketosteroid isomerase-like protein
MHRVRIGLFLVIGLVSAMAFRPTQAQDIPYERAMWPAENRFVAALIAGDADALAAMCHDDVSYWAAGEDRPWNKAYFHQLVNEWSGAEPGRLSTPMLEPIGAKILGDTAVTHFRLEFTVHGEDGVKAQRYLRLTHTWQMVDEEWKLLGGANAEISR